MVLFLYIILIKGTVRSTGHSKWDKSPIYYCKILLPGQKFNIIITEIARNVFYIKFQMSGQFSS